MASKTSSGNILSLSGQSIAYGLGQVGRAIVIYLLLPILTRILGRTEFGVVSVTTAFLSFTDILSDAGLPAATFRMYHEKNDPEYRREILGSSLLLFFVFAFSMAALIWVFASPLAGWLLKDADRAQIFRICALVMVMLTIFSYAQIIFRINVRPLANSLTDIIMVISQYGSALVFVAILGMNAVGYWQGHLVGATLTVVVVYSFLLRLPQLKVRWAAIKELVRYALPLIPASMAIWALNLVDRPIILSFYSLQDVALYELGYKIGSLVTFILAPFRIAWPQFALSIMKDEDAPRIYRDVLTAMITVCAFFAFINVSLRREFVLLLSSSEYLGAVNVVVWVVLAQITWAVFPILSVGLNISKKTTHIAWITIASAIINVILNVILLPIFGIAGAAMAATAAYGFMDILAYTFGRRQFHYSLDYVRIRKIILAVFVAGGYLYLAEQYLQVGSLALFGKIMSAPLFLVVLAISGFLSRQQVFQLYQEALQFLSRFKAKNNP